VPNHDLEAFQAGLIQGRKVWQRFQSFACGHRIGLDLARVDRPRCARGLVAEEIDLAAHQVVHGRSGALVGHGGQLRAQRLLQQHATEMRDRPQAGIGERDFLPVGLDILDQLADGVGRQVGPADNRHRHVGNQAGAGKGGGWIIGQLAVERSACCLTDVMYEEGVPIRLGPGDAGGGDGAAGAGRVLDDYRLPECLGHALPEQTRDGIGWPSRRERHEQSDWAGGIVRLRGRGTYEHGQSDEDDTGFAHRSRLLG
jgi:hypothetical protein